MLMSKGTSSISEFFVKMKGYADEMAAAGRKLEDEELISYILSGLDREYDAVVSAVAARVEPISAGELFTQLTSFESRMEMKNGGGGYQSSANMVAKGGRGNGNNFRGGIAGAEEVVVASIVEAKGFATVAAPPISKLASFARYVARRAMARPSATSAMMKGTRDLHRSRHRRQPLPMALTPTGTWTVEPPTTSHLS